MADAERIKDSGEHVKNPEALEKIRLEQQEAIQEKRLEHAGEKTQEKSADVAHEAMGHAKSLEKDQPSQKLERETATVERRKDGIISKKEGAANYKRTMSQVQKDLPVASRAFSKFIHNKAVERISDTVGSTIARPNAILTGSLTAFVFTLAIFLIARYFGYPLSGTETIVAFVLGWMVGLLYDYLHLEFTGGKS
ncbi:MAG: hypothetical protein JWM00_5 [Candidatus Saccharibacteria bacterium]|nr:hypothetical protein [Candidatus Saccharibacteria bacterium]